MKENLKDVKVSIKINIHDYISVCIYQIDFVECKMSSLIYNKDQEQQQTSKKQFPKLYLMEYFLILKRLTLKIMGLAN